MVFWYYKLHGDTHVTASIWGICMYICQRYYRVFKLVSIVDAYDLSEPAI